MILDRVLSITAYAFKSVAKEAANLDHSCHLALKLGHYCPNKSKVRLRLGHIYSTGVFHDYRHMMIVIYLYNRPPVYLY
jgi:hypothetical protein